MNLSSLLTASITVQPLLFLILALHGYRLSKYLKSTVSWWQACEAISLSLTLGLALPVRTGELIKPLYLQYKQNISFAQASGAVFVERAFDLFFFVLVTFFAFMIIGIGSNNKSFLILSAFLCILIAIILSYLLFGTRLINYLESQGFYRLSNFLQSGLSGMQVALREAFSLKILTAGLTTWIGTFVYYLLFFQIATNGIFSLSEISSLFIAGTLSIGIAVTPGGLGSFEAVIGGVLVHYDISLKDAIYAAIFFRIASSIPAAIITFIIFVKNAQLVTELKREVSRRVNQRKHKST